MLDIEKLLEELTLEEKAGLCSGGDQWHTKAVPRLGIPALKLSDGPHGMRTFDDTGKVIKAVCFPTGSALAASFDVNLAETIGAALGETAKSTGVHTVLGPAVNMKRSPLCGRNFEYLSEDPVVAGEMGAAMVRGIQSKGVGACPKHFAANNQETRRMSSNSNVDEVALREIYLTAFENIVKKSKPHTMMCAYNRVNGTYCCENEHLLTDILRNEWNYDGIVMTDWAAMNDRPKAVAAGLELEMPSSFGENDRRIVNAVRSGRLSMEALNEAVRRLLTWIDREMEGAKDAALGYDMDAQVKLAQYAAAECGVLLKNNGILPLTKGKKIAFIGGFAKRPRFEGGGSSHVMVENCPSALDCAAMISEITYAKGFSTAEDMSDSTLHAEAVCAAAKAEAAVIFAGLPASFESEGHDRTTLAIPECQNRLIEAVCEVQPNTVVVFHAGSPVIMPWRDKVAAILFMYLGGQGVGKASVDLLFGEKNPSGKLAETFPLRLEDTPAFLDFPGMENEVRYSEGIFIGYRWYEKRKIPVQYPFGHGLSYTSFRYSNLQIDQEYMQDVDRCQVRVDVTNTGSQFGKEVVQLYVGPVREKTYARTVKELKAFAKVALEPGETKTVAFDLNKRAFAHFNLRLNGWYVEKGTYRISLGSSSADIRLDTEVHVVSTDTLPVRYSEYMTVGDLWDSGLDVAEAMEVMKTQKLDLSAVGLEADKMERAVHMEEVKRGMPLHATVSMSQRNMEEVYNALRRIEGLEGKESIPHWN